MFTSPSDSRIRTTRSSEGGSGLMSPLLVGDEEEAHMLVDHGVSNDGSASLSLRRRPTSSLRPTTTTSTSEGDPTIEYPHHQTARILDRDARFGQSRGKWRIQRLSQGVRPGRISRPKLFLCFEDWFHNLAYKRTLILMGILFFVYTAIIFFFAFLYLLVSKVGTASKISEEETIEHSSFCGMDITNHMEALYFSLSTMTTIGYGVSDYYFGDCWTPLILVLFQVFCAITFDAVAIGLIFQRMSRSQKRCKTIIFSDKAVIRRVRGVPYLMFRIGELRRHHIIEAHVRVYCVRHERTAVESNNCSQRTTTTNNDEYIDSTASSTTTEEEEQTARQETGQQTMIETNHFLTRHVRLVSPNDQIGSFILMSIPQVVVHKIDDSSPIMPPKPVWYDVTGTAHRSDGMMESSTVQPDSGADVMASVFDRKKQSSELLSSNPPGGGVQEDPLVTTHNQSTSSSLSDKQRLRQYAMEHESIHKFLLDREAELIVLVEGTDELTGLALQARHSYRWDDIVLDSTFAPCIFPSSEVGEEYGNNGWECSSRCLCQKCCGRGKGHGSPICSVDFVKFHDLVPAPLDCDSCPYLPDER